MKAFICFIAGAFVSIGFLLLSMMVSYITIGENGVFNLLVAIAVIFSMMVSTTNLVIMKPSIEDMKGDLAPHARFLFFILGVWIVVIPYVELDEYSSGLVDILRSFVFLVSRLL